MMMYELINGEDVVYVGITDNINRAIEAHLKAGSTFSSINVQDARGSRDELMEKLASYQNMHQNK